MALAGDIMRYIGNEFVPMVAKTASSSLSSVIPSAVTKAGTSALGNVANKAISNAANKAVEKSVLQNIGGRIFQNGKPKSFYHGSPNPNIDKLDLSKAGSNTQSGENVLYFTDDYPTAEEFSYERLPSNSMFINNRGKKGKVYEKQLDLKNLVDLGNLSDEQIGNLYEYADAINRYDGKEKFIQRVKEDLLAGNDQSIKTRLDLNALKNSDYDGFIAKMYPNQKGLENVREYGVFNPDNVRDVRHIPINQVSNTEEVPVSTLRSLFRGQKKGSDDLYYNKGDGTTGSATVGNGYYMTPNADKAEVWAGEGINPISIEANTKDILTKNELVKKTKWANELINDEAYMADLWSKDPDMADFIENLSMGRLPEVSKYLDKPFIQPDSGQGEELAETIFFPDTRPELTRKIRDGLKASGSHAVMYEKNGRSLTEMANRIKAMNKAQDLDSGIKRIGNSEVAEIDANTLPAGYEKVKKYLGSSDAERIEEYTGANLENDSIEEYTNKLKKFLEEEGYDSDKTGAELLRDVRAVINEKMTEDLGMEGSTLYKDFFQTRGRLQKDNPLAGVGPSSFTISADKDKLYQTDAAKLDAEYSERLGIGRSHIPMSDKALSSDAQGYYMGGGIGINPRYASGESGVSTIAHERMHGWQDINKGEWDSRVGDAIDELRNELKKHYHTKAEIKAYRKSGSDLDYYANQNEQEARMLQSYLDNEGFTKTWRKQAGEPTEWGDEIKPAFDRFFKKLRALSRKGIALPAIAGLVGIGAIANKNDDKSVDNIK